MTPVTATQPTRLVDAVLLWTLVWTTLRGLRLPGDFAEAHWLLDYRFGFMKRGLVGTLGWLGAELMGAAMSPLVIAVLSGLIHAGFLWVLWLLLRRIMAALAPAVGEAAVLLALVVASSPFVVMSAHLLGYFDALQFLLAVATIALVMRGKPGWAGVIAAVAVLVHELYLLVGLPLVILALVRRRTAAAAATSPARDTKTRLTRADLVVLAPPMLAAFALFVAHAVMDGAVLRAQLEQHLDSFGFVATRSEFVALYQTTGFWDFFAQNRGQFLVRALDPRVLISVGPTLLLAVLAAHAARRLRAYGAASLGVLAAILAPLALHAVAWDTERISALAIGNATVALWALAVTATMTKPAPAREGDPAPARDLLTLVAVPALLLNVFFRIPLMDGEAERFTLAWRAVIYLPALALTAGAVWRRPRGSNDA
jgi:hypothetical protein